MALDKTPNARSSPQAIGIRLRELNLGPLVPEPKELPVWLPHAGSLFPIFGLDRLGYTYISRRVEPCSYCFGSGSTVNPQCFPFNVIYSIPLEGT